jgi:hypothetical protein
MSLWFAFKEGELVWGRDVDLASLKRKNVEGKRRGRPRMVCEEVNVAL